ncbi:MAG: hypothetical protein AAF468_07490 [Pseudomonadota bacterium]
MNPTKLEESRKCTNWNGFLDKFSCLTPNELGDFLAGASAPLAFVWLVIAVFIQSLELKAQREELEQTRIEVAASSKALEAQADHMREELNLVKEKNAEERFYKCLDTMLVRSQTGVPFTLATANNGEFELFGELSATSDLGKWTRGLTQVALDLGGEDLEHAYLADPVYFEYVFEMISMAADALKETSAEFRATDLAKHANLVWGQMSWWLEQDKKYRSEQAKKTGAI